MYLIFVNFYDCDIMKGIIKCLEGVDKFLLVLLFFGIMEFEFVDKILVLGEGDVIKLLREEGSMFLVLFGG